MSAPKTRTDTLLETWRTATARPIPAFDRPTQHTRERSRRPALLLITLALLLLVFVIGTVLLAGGAPSPSPVPTPSTSPGPPAGFWRFDKPGFAFDLPDAWTDETATLFYPPQPGLRIVGLLVRGMTLCPEGYGRLPPEAQRVPTSWGGRERDSTWHCDSGDLRVRASVPVVSQLSGAIEDRW